MVLGQVQASLRDANDVLVEILPPGVRACFWKGLVTHRLERIELTGKRRWRRHSRRG